MDQVLEKFNFISKASDLTFSAVLTGLTLSFLLGVVIAFIYKKNNKGFSYEESFGFSLVMVTVIITSIMMTIGSNLALSLGLIGSLSIIRFRTVVKNTADMVFLFWSISVGLAVGANNYPAAVGTVFFISLVVFLLNKIKFFTRSNSDYILVVRNSLDKGKINKNFMITEILSSNKLTWKVKTSFADNNANVEEVTYSIHLVKDMDLEPVLNKIKELSFVEKVSLLSPETNLFI